MDRSGSTNEHGSLAWLQETARGLDIPKLNPQTSNHRRLLADWMRVNTEVAGSFEAYLI